MELIPSSSLTRSFPRRIAPSTQFSVASAANAAVFVPNFGSGPASAPPTPSGPPGVGGAGAQEFVPRRVET